jgi:hypothetical protein
MLLLAATAPLWRTIDQPVALKGLVAMVARESEAGFQEITIVVDGGYAP